MRPLVALVVVAKLIALAIRTRHLAVVLIPAPVLIPDASLNAIPSVIIAHHANNVEALLIG
jgi:hypothetical protein